MMNEIATLTYNTTCDVCERTLLSGVSVCKVFDSNDSQMDTSLEEVQREWILTYCIECAALEFGEEFTAYPE